MVEKVKKYPNRLKSIPKKKTNSNLHATLEIDLKLQNLIVRDNTRKYLDPTINDFIISLN